MQQNRSKRYRASAEQVDRKKAYSLNDAMATLKKFQSTKFDQTVTVSFRLGVDPKQSDQMVRGTCPLPHGSGKKVRVLVFAEGKAADSAKEAGAEFVGFKDLIQRVQEGFQDFDVAVATPAAMAEVRKLGKVLGPRGLMPNPKTGTVTDDTAKAVQEVKAGRVEFKLDKNGNVAVPVGKFSFTESALVVKNSFLKRAMSDSGLPDVADKLSGQTAIVLGQKDVAPVAKILKTFAAEFKVAALKIGVIDKSVLSAREIEALADLPSREVLLAQLLGLLMSPATKLVRLLNEPGASLARLLNAKAQKEGKTAEASA